MSVVRLHEVTKRFGDVCAVDNVSLTVDEGEIFGLLGPNGAGKSTAINMIVGLLRANGGTVEVLGRNVSAEPLEARRDVGIVPQELAIYEDLTSIENVRFFASLYGLRGGELTAAAEQALEFTGLGDKARSMPKKFSGGMKRRLNIACAIAHRPRLLIMDEPTVGIDPQSRHHILHSVRRLNAEGCTIIYTSHYMDEVEEICSRIAILDHGKIIAEGSTPELVALVSDASTVWVTLASLEGGGSLAGLADLSGVENVDVEELTVRVTSRREANNLDRIIAFFTSRGLQIRAIESKNPDLETVFLSLTGRTLRD